MLTIGISAELCKSVEIFIYTEFVLIYQHFFLEGLWKNLWKMWITLC